MGPVRPQTLNWLQLELQVTLACARSPPQGHGGFLLPSQVATWAAALLASMAGLAASELPTAAEFLDQTAKAARTE